MATAPYNAWYNDTYDSIFKMANWTTFSADVPKKVVCVYSWMPQTLMGVKHTGGRPKWASFSLNDVQAATRAVDSEFSEIHALTLREVNIDECDRHLRTVISALIQPFGVVAASKYLHFSAPKLFPMWDRSIRLARGHADTVDGFIEYMRAFKVDLLNPANMQAALAQYPANAVRGWDIVNMRNRDA